MNRQWVCIDVGCGAEAADELAGAIADAFGVGVEVLAEGFDSTSRRISSVIQGGKPWRTCSKPFNPFPTSWQRL